MDPVSVGSAAGVLLATKVGWRIRVMRIPA
jgi:hypothetical protein